jgi:hypothetical protein
MSAEAQLGQMQIQMQVKLKVSVCRGRSIVTSVEARLLTIFLLGAAPSGTQTLMMMKRRVSGDYQTAESEASRPRTASCRFVVPSVTLMLTRWVLGHHQIVKRAGARPRSIAQNHGMSWSGTQTLPMAEAEERAKSCWNATFPVKYQSFLAADCLL